MPTITELPNDADFRTTAMAIAGGRVDREKRTIFGCSLMQLGELNDSRPWFVDRKTLDQALALMEAGGGATKARYTHPNMSNDGLGSYLGRWVNPRIDNGHLRADLVLSERAFTGPRGDIGTYILDMAEGDADMLGVSLATRMNRKAMKSDARADGKQPIRFSAIRAGDVVDEPAATRGGLFESSSLAELPLHATQVLDHYFEAATPDVIRTRAEGFLDRYLTNRFGDAAAMSKNNDTDQKPNEGNPTPEGNLTRADLDSVLGSFGEKLLSQVDEKLSKLGGAKGEGDEVFTRVKGPKVIDEEPGQLSADQIRTAERKRVSDLMALATNAGLSNAEKTAQEWIDKDLSVTDAKAALGDIVVKQNMLSSGEGDDGLDTDLDAKLKAEFRAQSKVHASLGVSEEDYIEHRKAEIAKGR